MAKPSYKSIPYFNYLGILQLFTALCAGAVSFLFITIPKGPVFDYILKFLPDASLVNYSIIGLVMLAVQFIGNMAGALFSFKRSESAGNVAIGLGGAEMFWMFFQFVILHMHSTLMLVFFALAMVQAIFGYLIIKSIKKVHKEFRDALCAEEDNEIQIAGKIEYKAGDSKKPVFEESDIPFHLKN